MTRTGRQQSESAAGSAWKGILEAGVIVAGFVVFGLGLAALEWGGQPAPYPEGAMAEEPTPLDRPARIWLVDGYNVLCTGLLGGADRRDWWSRENRELLATRAEQLDPPDAEIWLAFDGSQESDDPTAGRVHTVFAPSADDWLLREVRQRLPTPEAEREVDVVVVTADRQLADRVRHRGGSVVTPRDFLGRCMG